MQLKKPNGAVQSALMAASCALLSSSPARSDTSAPADGDWLVDSALLYYQEDHNRVQAIEPVVSLSKDFGDDRKLALKLTFDSLSGGSPNGALPSNQPQTFSSPSGASLQAPSGTPSGRVDEEQEHVSLYTVAPGELPLDPTFRDQRAAVNVNWQQRVGEFARLSLGGDLSYEHDFASAAVNAAIARDFNNRNTTLSLGANFEDDRINPIGGAPVGGSDYTLLLKGGNEAKTVAGGLLGVTQVLSRRWLAQLNFTYDRSNGYLTDPYKILSMLDTSGNTTGYRFEIRPDVRTRKSVFLENKVAVGHDDVLDLSLRYMTDDWGIKSRTAELRYRWELGGNMYVEPHVRYYSQSAADFYNLYLNSTDAVPEFMSADARLGKFNAATLGVKFGMELDGGGEFSLRLEGYEQSPQDVPAGFGELQGLDLNPGLKALMLQVGYRFAY
jgi:hypothetical protein